MIKLIIDQFLKNIKSPLAILKIVELVLGVVVLCLWRYGGAYNAPLFDVRGNAGYLPLITMTAFVITSAVCVFCLFLEDLTHLSIMNRVLNPLAACMYIASGVLAIQYGIYLHKNGQQGNNLPRPLGTQRYVRRLEALGGLCIINGTVYIVDLVITTIYRIKNARNNV